MTDRALPAVALAAVPGRRRRTLDLAREIERRGFAGIYCASFGDAMGLCEALAFATERIPFGTSIANLHTRHVSDYAQTASLIHELSGGRFHFGVGVSHGSMNRRLGIQTGRPLDDARRFADGYRKARAGELPPLVLAALRPKMVALAGEVADGVVFANAARSALPALLRALPDERRTDPEFFIGNMIPTCISEDRAAAAAVNRRTFGMYLTLPNYRHAWRDAGYAEEIAAIEQAIESGVPSEGLPERMGDRWLSDVSLFGSVREVRDGVEAWRAAGVRTPILVPSSAAGNQLVAFEELFAAFA
ncbi:LLM class flavin-dependent oxidoreductase [Myxococcota bacterium]|nr:LLM class flavin-dependent oxidoreductase [Myxococcota bacterium]MCZ7619796.1 LLM class flavin-dependent oxidoreductase [Myxococcota bacterium]